MSSSSPLRGIALKIAATFVFVGMGVSVRLISDHVPIGQIVFSRAFFALIPLLLWVFWNGAVREALAVTSFSAHVKRGITGIASMFTGFAGLTMIPLADSVAINYAVPLITVPLAAFVLKEQVRMYRWSAVAIGFVGVIITLSPHLGGTHGPTQMAGASLTLASAIFTAFAMIEIRKMVETETTAAIVFYFMIICAVMALLSLPFGWVWPTPYQAAILVCVGVLGGLGQILMTASYRYADASLIAPFDYISMVWASIFGYVLFGDWPVREVWIGVSIVIASGLFVVYREHVLGRRRNAERAAATDR